MREKLNRSLCIFIVILFTSQGVIAQDSATESWKDIVRGSMNGLSNAPSATFEGMAATFVSNDTYWTHSIGQANDTGLAVDPDRKWLFRSYTKLMVSVIILQLHEEQLLDLSDPISEHLDPITNVNMSDTIEDLLHMRSRMCTYINGSNSVSDQVDENKSAILDTKTMLEVHLDEGPCNENRTYVYNDANFQVLGLIIEAVTGKSGEQVFEDRIIEPFGLTNTALAPLDLERDEFNGLYRTFRVNDTTYAAYDESMESLNSLLTSQKFSAGVMGTTSDMMRFTKALLDTMVLESSTLDLMKSNPVFDEYGKGLMILEMKGEAYDRPHNIPIYEGKYYGHGGNARNTSRTFYDPERKIGFSFVFNSSNPGGMLYNTDRFTENMYSKMRECLIDGGCLSLPNEREDALTINRFELAQNYPNPFNPSTNISFSVPNATEVSLRVFNLLGQEVANLVNERIAAGTHTVNFDASNLASGVYIYQLISGEFVQTKKMLLIK